MGALGIAAGDVVSSLSVGMNKIGASAANKGSELATSLGKSGVSKMKP